MSQHLLYEARARLASARAITILTGAGISADSGVPTFRGADGLCMSIHNRENLISNAFRRSIRLREAEVVPRISDLAHLTSSMKGKIEWDFADEAGESEKINLLVRDAAALVFKKSFRREPFADFLKAFATGEGIEVSEADASSAYLARISVYPQLAEKAALLAEGSSPALLAWPPSLSSKDSPSAGK